MLSWDDLKEIATGIRELSSSFQAEVIEPAKRDFRETVLEKYDSRYLQVGDVIGAPYTMEVIPFIHYGIYVGNDEVIHFAKNGNDTEESIHYSSIGSFASPVTGTFFLVDFEKFLKDGKFMPAIATGSITAIGLPLLYKNHNKNYVVPPSDLVVARAKSRLGEKGYNLLSNNCEHFAMWCKTGIKECNQIVFFDILSQYRIYFSLSNYK